MSRRRWAAEAVAVAAAGALLLLGPGPGGAVAPPGRFVVSANTVVDGVTGLTWQQAFDPIPRTWLEALAACEALSLGGHDDWRLPSVKELQTIVDERAHAPAIDLTVFPSTPNQPFWSSSACAGGLEFGWVVSFGYGDARAADAELAHLVRCVR